MSKRNAGTPLSQAIKACMPAFASIAFISVFINLTMLAMPLYSMQISDRVMQSRNGGTLVMLTIIVVVFQSLPGKPEHGFRYDMRPQGLSNIIVPIKSLFKRSRLILVNIFYFREFGWTIRAR
jgi:hypothetical protein